MSSVLGRVLSHSRAWSHPDKDLASSMCWWGNPRSLVLVVPGLLGQGQSLERDNRWTEELFRAEIWT